MARACADDGLSSKISGLSGLLSISSILSLVLLVFPRPSKGSVWGSTQTHVGAGTRALLGPRASASRRRALRGAARGGADAVSRFPLLAPEARCGALRTPSEHPREGCSSMAYQRGRRSLKIIERHDGGPVQGQRPYSQPSRQPTAGGNAQPKGSSSRPRRARCCYICGFCFYEFWGVIT